MTEIPTLEPARASWWDRLSIIWIVPMLALVVALAVAWNNWSSRGPLIEVTFDNAAGIAARETELRYRDVTVGVVERVQFTSDLRNVIVAIRLDPQVAPFVDGDAQFWVVRPQISTTGVSGIETVLSGVYIAGTWDELPSEVVYEHAGRNEAPLLEPGQRGLRITVRASDNSLTSAVPILYKGVEVGQLGPPRVSTDGLTVEANGVVYAPYDALVTEATRFWDVSGFDVSIGTSGAGIEFQSLASVLLGGIAFDTFVSGATLAPEGSEFLLYPDVATARDSLYVDATGPTVEVMAIFDGGATGLSPGATVEVDGLRVGEVQSIAGVIDPEAYGDNNVRLKTVLSLRPSRLGLEGEAGADETLRWLEERVATSGLRARLATGSILTGALKVQLVTVADGAPAEIDFSTLPYPTIPSTDGEIADVAASAQGTLERIDALPIEELLASAIGFLDNASTLVGSPETQAVPREIAALIGDVRGVTASPEVQAIPEDLSRTLAEIDAAVVELRGILQQVREEEGVTRVLAAVDRAGAAAEQITTVTEGVPALVDRITTVADNATSLDFATLSTEVSGLATDARALAQSLQPLPDQVSGLATEATAAVTDARAALADLDVAGISARLDATLASAEAAAADLQTSLDGLPGLVERINSVAAKADALPLEDLVGEIQGLAASANNLVSAPSTQQLPADLSSALAEAEAILREARDGGVVTNANAALASIRQAADTLPGLVGNAQALLDRASGTLSTFDENARVVREAQAAMQEVAAAAEAVAQLARTIERNPNALLFGR